jgi:hypothetical protein
MQLSYSDVGECRFSPSLTTDNRLGALRFLLRHR